jgi:hypothetical protein
MFESRKSRDRSLAPIMRAGAVLLASFLGFAIARRATQRGYQLLELTAESRERLLAAYPPKFKQVIADHITVRYDVSRANGLPLAPTSIRVLGYVSDESLECIVVAVDGQYTRVDNLVYHITLSKQQDRQAKESNDLIASQSWKEHTPAPLFLQAAPRFRYIKQKR